MEQKSIPTQQNIKQMHLKQIFLKALRSGGISRAQLRQEMHLSFPSVSALVEELLERGILFEDGLVATAERGRPRSILRVNPHAFAVPVAVLTAEGYRCTAFDCCGNRLEERFLPLSAEDGRPDIAALSSPLQTWLEELRKTCSPAELILTVPGNFRETGSLSATTLGFSTPENFICRLQQRLGLEVLAFNNADCCAYGEKYCQALPEDFIVITVNKGVGPGIIRHGAVFSGGILRGGEIGHISIDYNGEPCSCGSRGCLERYINTDQITREACRLLELPEEDTHFEDICKLYRQKDARLIGLISEKARLLALGISNMLTMQPVTHIVIGGDIVKLGEDFLTVLQGHIKTVGLRKYMDRVTTVCCTRSTENPEALGAFWNYLDHRMRVRVLTAE